MWSEAAVFIQLSPSFCQIITALEEDSTAQKMQLGYRLQQIAAAVENKVTDLWPRSRDRFFICQLVLDVTWTKKILLFFLFQRNNVTRTVILLSFRQTGFKWGGIADSGPVSREPFQIPTGPQTGIKGTPRHRGGKYDTHLQAFDVSLDSLRFTQQKGDTIYKEIILLDFILTNWAEHSLSEFKGTLVGPLCARGRKRRTLPLMWTAVELLSKSY